MIIDRGGNEDEDVGGSVDDRMTMLAVMMMTKLSSETHLLRWGRMGARRASNCKGSSSKMAR